MVLTSEPGVEEGRGAGGILIESLTQALQSTRLFQTQTAERVSSMKLGVLHAYENDAGGQDSQYKRDVTAKIVSLVEARAASVEEFRRSQESAEKLMASLKGHPDGPAANVDREKIVDHFKVSPSIAFQPPALSIQKAVTATWPVPAVKVPQRGGVFPCWGATICGRMGLSLSSSLSYRNAGRWAHDRGNGCNIHT